jgi:hypothetical protein
VTREQLTIAGTDPDRNPHIDEALMAWLNAGQEKRAAGKREKNHHASLVLRVTEAGLKKYPYTDPDSGKRRYVFPEQKVTMKTSKAPGERKGRGRRRKAEESADRDSKPDNVSQPPELVDPFEATRAKMREGQAERQQRSVLDEARDAQQAEGELASGDPEALEQAGRETEQLEQRAKRGRGKGGKAKAKANAKKPSGRKGRR